MIPTSSEGKGGWRGRGGQKGKEEAEGEEIVNVGKSGYRETWIRQGKGEEQIEGGIVDYQTEGRKSRQRKQRQIEGEAEQAKGRRNRQREEGTGGGSGGASRSKVGQVEGEKNWRRERRSKQK